MLFHFGERWICLFVISMPRGIKTGLILFLCCASDKHEVAIFVSAISQKKLFKNYFVPFFLKKLNSDFYLPSSSNKLTTSIDKTK